jgi:hypothetical protein
MVEIDRVGIITKGKIRAAKLKWAKLPTIKVVTISLCAVIFRTQAKTVENITLTHTEIWKKSSKSLVGV